MEMVQIAMTNSTYRQALSDLLIDNGEWEVKVVEQPDLAREGVVVVDFDHLPRIPTPIRNPERVVLIAGNEPGQIVKAWEAGVNSMVLEKEPPSTAMLAVLSATLRNPKTLASSSRAAPAKERFSNKEERR